MFLFDEILMTPASSCFFFPFFLQIALVDSVTFAAAAAAGAALRMTM